MRTWMLVTFLLAVVFAVPLGFAVDGADAANDRLVIGADEEAIRLDPRLATDVASFQRIHTIMEPLVSFGTDMSLTPRLAHAWEFGEDGLSITFHLREGVPFHHGREFTAKDVQYTFNWVLDPNNQSAHRPLYADIERIEADGDYTVIFHLGSPNGFLINNIARLPIVPYDKGDDPDFERAPVGTGPYVFESWRRDDRLIVRAFDDYWGGRAHVDVVEFRPIPEHATRLLAFEAGEIDMYQGGVVPDELPRIEQDSRFIVQRVPGLGYYYLGFNMDVGALDDVRVRQAISHLIHREGIVGIVMNGIGRPGISMISPDLPWFNPDVKRFDYDPDKARELLAEAGVESGRLSLQLHTSENPDVARIAEILEYELSQVGVALRIHVEEWGAFLTRIQQTDDYEMYLLSWHGQVDPDRAMWRQFHSEGSHNYSRYVNPRVDELLERGRLTPPDSEESIEIYGEAQALVVEEVPFAFINYTEEIGFQHRNIEGWTVHPHGSATWQDIHLIRKGD